MTVSDVRQTALKTEAFDLVISTSTLDHFSNPDDFTSSIQEIHRMIRPGGLLIVTLDNSSNPLYLPFRLLSPTRFAPFYLNYSLSMRTLKGTLREAGFDVERVDWLLHNPGSLQPRCSC